MKSVVIFINKVDMANDQEMLDLVREDTPAITPLSFLYCASFYLCM